MTKDEEMWLRELAAGRCVITKVTEQLGPMSLWSKDGLEAEIQRAVEAEREAFTVHAMTSAEKAIDVAIKLEREACAEICDGFYLSWIEIQGRYEFMGEGASECAGAIRARGQQ
jgi:hypothetical protein